MEGAFFWWRNENARNEQDSRLSLRDDRQEEESAEGIYEERPEGREIIESLGQEGYAEECCEEAQGQSPEARDGKDNEARFGWRSFGRNVFVQTDKEKEKEHEEALRRERINALRHQPLLRTEIAKKRWNMKNAAWTRMLSVNMFQDMQNGLFECLTRKPVQKGTVEWHEREAERLRKKRKQERERMKAQSLRKEDADKPGIWGPYWGEHQLPKPLNGKLPQ